MYRISGICKILQSSDIFIQYCAVLPSCMSVHEHAMGGKSVKFYKHNKPRAIDGDHKKGKVKMTCTGNTGDS